MHIAPSSAALAALHASAGDGPVVMLNLLRFRETADYGGSPELAPASPITGEHAFRRYGAHAAPLLEKAGAEVIFQGTASGYLIGPEGMRWDRVLLVRYPTAKAFLGFVSSPDYLRGVGHRTAALEDSRLLPMTPA